MTFFQWVVECGRRLSTSPAAFADANRHARDLACGVLGWNTHRSIVDAHCALTVAEVQRLEGALERRLRGEPLQYILGYTWFWKHRFKVGPGVLVPRPETERLVEKALAKLPQGPLAVAELGPGSGAIGISLLSERPQWQWRAWEIHPPAGAYLTANLDCLLPEGDFQWVQGDFFKAVFEPNSFDWFVSNPPYVASGEIGTLSAEVQSEPREALDGGESGLAVIERLLSLGATVLRPEGGILLEIGCDQGPKVDERLRHWGYVGIEIEKDLEGLDRVAYGRRP